MSHNIAVRSAYAAGTYTDLEGNEWVKGMDGWFLDFGSQGRCLVWHHDFVEKIEKEHPDDKVNLREATKNPARLVRMKPILDRIPAQWGKWLPMVGWDDLLLEADSSLAEIDPEYHIYQVKQKFGELRYYAGHSDGFLASEPTEEDQADFQAVVTWAEDRSKTTCEHCGAPGVRRSGGWISVLCDTHAKVDAPVE